VPPDDLTEAEAALWDAYACGKFVDLRKGDPQTDNPARSARWGSGRTIRGEVISRLVLGAQPGESGFVPGVLLAGTRSLDPNGTGRTRRTMRWKPALNAFAITFADRFPSAETH